MEREEHALEDVDLAVLAARVGGDHLPLEQKVHVAVARVLGDDRLASPKDARLHLPVDGLLEAAVPLEHPLPQKLGAALPPDEGVVLEGHL